MPQHRRCSWAPTHLFFPTPNLPEGPLLTIQDLTWTCLETYLALHCLPRHRSNYCEMFLTHSQQLLPDGIQCVYFCSQLVKIQMLDPTLEFLNQWVWTGAQECALLRSSLTMLMLLGWEPQWESSPTTPWSLESATYVLFIVAPQGLRRVPGTQQVFLILRYRFLSHTELTSLEWNYNVIDMQT